MCLFLLLCFFRLVTKKNPRWIKLVLSRDMPPEKTYPNIISGFPFPLSAVSENYTGRQVQCSEQKSTLKEINCKTLSGIQVQKWRNHIPCFKHNLDTTKPGLGYHGVAKPGITDRALITLQSRGRNWRSEKARNSVSRTLLEKSCGFYSLN